MNVTEFQQVVSDLESARSFPHRRALWMALAATQWAKEQNLSPGALRQQARRLKVRVSTPPNPHRVRLKIQGDKAEAVEPTQTPDLGSDPRPPATTARGTTKERVPLPVLRSHTPAKFQPLVDRIEDGSIRAAVKLKCLECSSYQVEEIRLCTVPACPLHSVRPYQSGEKETRLMGDIRQIV
jgi:hypothetical protein